MTGYISRPTSSPKGVGPDARLVLHAARHRDSMLFDSVAFKNIISNGLVLDKNGNKMSKRLGNAVDPFEVLDNLRSRSLRAGT